MDCDRISRIWLIEEFFYVECGTSEYTPVIDTHIIVSYRSVKQANERLMLNSASRLKHGTVYVQALSPAPANIIMNVTRHANKSARLGPMVYLRMNGIRVGYGIMCILVRNREFDGLTFILPQHQSKIRGMLSAMINGAVAQR